MSAFLPIFIKSSAMRCLVVGAGNTAAMKTKSLLKHGIKPAIIAPDASEQMLDLIDLHKLDWSQRIFMAHDAKNYNMIVAATSSKVVNHLIKAQISECILFNDTSNVENSNFILPVVIDRGPVKLAVSTSGQAPYLSKEIGAYLDKILPDFSEKKLHEITEKRNSIILKAKEDKDLKKKLMDNELYPLIIDLLKG